MSVRFWSVSSSIEAMQEISGLMDRNPPAYAVTTAVVDTAAAVKFDAGNNPDPRTGSKMPFPENLIQQPMKLVISDPEFDQDYVNQGGIFVSKQLREAFDLPPHTVQYIRPDTSGSSQRVIDQDYMWMSVLAYRNAIDLERSEPFQFPPSLGPTLVKVMKHVVFREDFESDVPLFHDPNDQKLYATDAFADRILRSGATAIAFRDYSSLREDSNDILLKRLES